MVGRRGVAGEEEEEEEREVKAEKAELTEQSLEPEPVPEEAPVVQPVAPEHVQEEVSEESPEKQDYDTCPKPSLPTEVGAEEKPVEEPMEESVEETHPLQETVEPSPEVLKEVVDNVKDRPAVFAYYGRQPKTIMYGVVVLELHLCKLPKIVLNGEFIFPDVEIVKVLPSDISIITRPLPNWLKQFPKLREVFIGCQKDDGTFIATMEIGDGLYRLIAKIPNILRINGRKIRGTLEGIDVDPNTAVFGGYTGSSNVQLTQSPEHFGTGEIQGQTEEIVKKHKHENIPDLDLFTAISGLYSSPKLWNSPPVIFPGNATSSSFTSSQHKNSPNLNDSLASSYSNASSMGSTINANRLSPYAKKEQRYNIPENMKILASKTNGTFRMPHIPNTNLDVRNVMPISQLLSFITGLCKFIERTSRNSKGDGIIAYRLVPLKFLSQYSRLVYGDGVTYTSNTGNSKTNVLSLGNLLSSFAVISAAAEADNYANANPFILWAYHAFILEDISLHVHLDIIRVAEILKKKFVNYVKEARVYKIQQKIAEIQRQKQQQQKQQLQQMQQKKKSEELNRQRASDINVQTDVIMTNGIVTEYQNMLTDSVGITGAPKDFGTADMGLNEQDFCLDNLGILNDSADQKPLGIEAMDYNQRIQSKLEESDYPGITYDELADISLIFKVSNEIVSGSRPIIIGHISSAKLRPGQSRQSNVQRGGLEKFLASTFPWIFGTDCQPVPFIEGEVVTFPQFINRVSISVIAEWIRRSALLRQLFRRLQSDPKSMKSLDLINATRLERDLKQLGLDIGPLSRQIHEEGSLSLTDLVRTVIGESLVL